MRKGVLPVYRPVSGLKVARVCDQSVSLRSNFGLVEASVLAPDLFRLRMTSRQAFSERPSWAVCKTDWPEVPVRMQASGSRVSLRTACGRLRLRLADGGWRLQDSAGREVFAAVATETGWARPRCQLTLTLAEGESLFGLGETTGTFNKRGLIREFWNTDVLGHASAIYPGLRSLYVSVPFALSLRHGRAAGLFWDNPARQTWDLGQTRLDRWQMTAASGEMDLYLFLGPRVSEVVARYTELTGRMPLPPRWALGYQQSRYSYETRGRVEEIAGNFRRRRVPCDVLYLDIHHMDGYRVFTFGKTFPRPAEMIARLARQGFKVVTIVDPGVKNDSRFGLLKRGLAAKAFVKAPDSGKDFIGRVWPGETRFPDFLNARVRRWWGEEQNRLLELGVAGFWNDMDEPANFALPTKTLPEECVHQTDFGPMKHAEAHNLYGLEMARGSREGALAHQPDRRPFVITRAGYAGVQRYGLVWTGDNSSMWEHLADAVQMCLNLGLSGLAFCGSDVGGFMDNTSPELLARWTQMAAFTPFFRNHSNNRTIDQEPWALGTRTEQVCRRYIELRYQLLPYLYSLFIAAHRTGAPIIRPLLWHYQDDPIAVAAGDQFLLGPNLLVAPVLRQGAVARSVYLPRGAWYDFWIGQRYEGARHVVAEAPLEIIPLFVHAGAIVPFGPVQQYVGENEPGTVNLHVWPGAPGKLNWYEDDGFSMSYTTGNFHEREVTFTPGRSGVLRLGAAKGAYASRVRTWRVILRETERRRGAVVNGRKVAVRFDAGARLLALEIPNSAEPLTIRFD